MAVLSRYILFSLSNNGKSCCLTGSNESIIFDSEKGVVFIVDHNKKEYAEVPINLFDAGGATESESEELSQAQQMAKMMAEETSPVTPMAGMVISSTPPPVL